MLEIGLNKVVKNYGFKNVLDEFDLEVTTGEKVALIGPNGCGKTTIFKMILSEEGISSGSISVKRDASIGFLSQTPSETAIGCTVKEVLTRGFQEIYKLEIKMQEIELNMGNCDGKRLEVLLSEYGKIQELYEHLGGYELEHKIAKVCSGFKIDNDMLNRPFDTLSGGEKTIVNFASLILINPSILLLDEPTNHLDIDTLEWLEEYLKNYSGTIVISSHDRYFLDKVATKTVLVDKGKSEVFHGNYSYYLEENERRTMAEFEEFKTQQKKIEAMKNAVKKLREWGRISSNEKFFKRALSIEKRLEKLELLDKPETKKELPLSFQIDQRSGNDVLQVKNLGLIVGDKILLENASFCVRYGDKVCMMGKNGSGKSTFIKALLGSIDICDGEIKLGSNVKIGYIPQEIRFDDENEDVLTVAKKNFNGSETQLRAALAKFLFYGENVFKRVGNLSGGEKVRLKLFDLINQKANFLVLDEPTNHIDIETKEMLEEALVDYNGTLLFISHDRYFINKLASRVLSIENSSINQYEGNYDYYREKRLRK